MLDHEIDVERDEDTPPERVGVKQRWDIKTVGVQESLDDPDELRRQILVGAGEAVAELGECLPGGLENEALEAEAICPLSIGTGTGPQIGLQKGPRHELESLA